MKLKINKPLKDHKVGTVITVPDEKGVPLEHYWRRRVKDAKIDNCVEIVPNTPKTPKGGDKK